MCVQRGFKTLILLVLFVSVGFLLDGCEAIDNIVPSSGSYKINVQINGVSVDECSYARSIDRITPCFEEPVTGDPDVTALAVFLKNSQGEVVGWKVIYVLDKEAKEKEDKPLTDENKNVKESNNENKNVKESNNENKENENKEKDENENEADDDDDDDDDDKDEDDAVISEDENVEEATLVADIETPEFYEDGDELIVPVLSLDKELPSFPMPENLPMGVYTMVSQVMSDKTVLQRTEKNIFYLGKNTFSYKGINVYLPGTGGTSHLIPKGMVVMLEVNLDFDKRLDPHIVWYEGKNKIKEGNFSNDAGFIFWKAPEQSGFFSLRAEIFPVEGFDDLTGYKKEISLLVSSKITDVNLASPNVMQLTHWYTMEGNLNDSKMPASPERALKPASGTKLKWMGLDGTYGLATGNGSIITLPKIPVVNKEVEIWQTLFRFKPISNGNIFSIQFGSSGGVLMTLYMEDKALILKLISPLKTVSQIVGISVPKDESSESVQVVGQNSSFLTAGVKFSIQSGFLTAQINIIGNPTPVELAVKPITLEAEIKNEFNIMLGFHGEALFNQLKAPIEEVKKIDESETVEESDKVETVEKFEEVDKPASSVKQVKASVLPEYTVLWDEFALYYMPPKDILTITEKPVINEEQPITRLEN